MVSAEELVQGIFWSLVTIAAYLVARAVSRWVGKWWASPLVVAPVLVLAVVLTARVGYDAYIQGTHWLMLALGPATVAFALPIYEHRAVIRRHWPVLLVGVVVGSVIAVGSAWVLADVMGLSADMRQSLLPRSMSMPFALIVADDIGGNPDATAILVVLTAVVGVALGETLLKWLPGQTALMRGAIFGIGAHGAGVAKATQIGREEGSIAGLVMVLTGVANVLIAPLVMVLIR